MEYNNINNTGQTVEGKKVYRGRSKNGTARLIVKIECKECGEQSWVDKNDYLNHPNNFCGRQCASKSNGRQFSKTGSDNPNYKGKIDYVKRYKQEGKCTRCGESHPSCLVFHHINGEKTENISRMRDTSEYDLEDIKREIDKCQLVCANCHRKEHNNTFS